MFRATEACRAPFVEAFCYGTREDEWVVAHCGPIKVHLFTREMREQYQLLGRDVTSQLMMMDLLFWSPHNEIMFRREKPGGFPQMCQFTVVSSEFSTSRAMNQQINHHYG